GRFRGRDVVVIGGGQSAIEFAALLHEAGAAVQVVSRRPVQWLEPDRSGTRSTVERILAPDASIAPGWINWVWDRMPVLFYRFPQGWKDWYNALYHSGATDWLRERVLGKVTLRECRTVARLRSAVSVRCGMRSGGPARGRGDHTRTGRTFPGRTPARGH